MRGFLAAICSLPVLPSLSVSDGCTVALTSFRVCLCSLVSFYHLFYWQVQSTENSHCSSGSLAIAATSSCLCSLTTQQARVLHSVWLRPAPW